MNDNLDKWIHGAKGEIPDPGEYRRLNRALIKDGLLVTKREGRRRHRLLIISITLVFLVLLSGQISQLGSDDFDRTVKVVEQPWGETVTVYTDEFRHMSVNLPDHFTAADRDEFFRSSAAGEGEITMVTGVSYGGKTQWIKHIKKMVNDKESHHGETPDSPASEEPDDIVAFLMDHYKDMVGHAKATRPQRTVQMMVDGVLIDLGVWTYDFDGYGEVTQYRGLPATSP